jgi:hypothetical protein
MSEAVLKRKMGNIVFPQYSQFEARVASFKNTNPSSMIYNFKTEFAETGFFFTLEKMMNQCVTIAVKV